ncbi:coiled-coil domain-containing protein 185 [Hyperolius riggenbachi]|uniref:coiled-coil domain-containing protein 185 n=1 Tax=Hyperolius riggenbachi TaxID=752182 RepID=UPI0035A2D0EC
MEGGRASPTLHLDLNNFEEGQGSRYVLTSPRSLEACARLGVKPVELLHKSLREVREENLHATSQQINDLFIIQEKERCRKLRRCRELRMKLLQGDSKPKGDLSHSARHHKPGLPPSSPLPDCLNPPPVSTPRWAPQDFSARDYRKATGTLRKSLSQGDLRPEEKAYREARKVEKAIQVSVPDRDKKIAALMLLKHQEEQMQMQRRLRVQQAWDNLKAEERHIRAALDKTNWVDQMQNNKIRNRTSQLKLEIDPTCYFSSPNNKKWKTLPQEQQIVLNHGLKVSREDLESKILSQEPLFAEKDANDKSTSGHLLEERMMKAFKAKMFKDFEDKKNIQIKNEYEKIRHSRLKEKVDNEAKAEEHFRRISMKQKEQKSQVLHEQLVGERRKDLHEKASREDELTLMARLRAIRQEKEQMQHKELLARLTSHKIQQATDVLEKSIRGKAEKARELNMVKEVAHEALRKKVDQEKENHRKYITHIIRMKDQKSEKIRKDKEATVEEGRRIARASFHLRDKIREQTRSRTFDQMALQAQLSASLMKTIP